MYASGNVRNVQMLNCGMIVWDAPEDADCCHDKLTYKVRFFNGTSFSAAPEDYRKVMSVENSWIKFTGDDLPYGRPLQVMVGLVHCVSATEKRSKLIMYKIVSKLCVCLTQYMHV